jgi:hypothetical protein
LSKKNAAEHWAKRCQAPAACYGGWSNDAGGLSLDGDELLADAMSADNEEAVYKDEAPSTDLM